MRSNIEIATYEHICILDRIQRGYQTQKDYLMLPMWCDILECSTKQKDFMGEPLACQIFQGKVIPPIPEQKLKELNKD